MKTIYNEGLQDEVYMCFLQTIGNDNVKQVCEDYAHSIGIPPGAFTDRVRNMIYIHTNGETGRDTNRFGVGWIEEAYKRNIQYDKDNT